MTHADRKYLEWLRANDPDEYIRIRAEHGRKLYENIDRAKDWTPCGTGWLRRKHDLAEVSK